MTILLLGAPAAHAQRVESNATAQAEDAFGVNVSGEALGLYDRGDVRGFSPTSAGNLRLDGMYYDLQGGFTDRLIGGYRILVGPSVLGHPFPAPSGIVDYAMRRPGRQDLLSVDARIDSLGARQLEVDGKLHDLLPGFGLTGGVGLYRSSLGRGGGARIVSRAVTAVWQPSSRSEIVPFYSRISVTRSREEPIFILSGDRPAPPVRGTAFLGQDWARGEEFATNYGLLGRLDLGGWRLRGSVFRSQDFYPLYYTPLFVETQLPGLALRQVVAERNTFAGATSAEIQLSRTLGGGERRSRVYLAAWGRDQQRRYGATDAVDLPPAGIETSAPAAKPDLAFGPLTRDRVRQITLGIAYEFAWRGVGNLNVGVQRTRYRKSVAEPGRTLPASLASQWLFNVAASVDLTRRAAIYGGISRGLEESDVAPAVAVNRNQAPPAIRTDQMDLGLRWKVLAGVTLVGNLFQIEKPYSGLDAARVFRNLGRIRHRGVEMSLAGSPLTGLSVIAGGVLLDAAVGGEQVDAGVVGRRPVGSTPVSLIGSVDYRIPALRSLSFDANLSVRGRRTATVDNGLSLPPQALLGLGMRARFKVGRSPAVFRLQASNVTDAYGWGIIGSGALKPDPPRRVVASIAIDI